MPMHLMGNYRGIVPWTALVILGVIAMPTGASAYQQPGPAYCNASDPATAYLQGMSEIERRDFGFQAQGLGRTVESHAQASVTEICSGTPSSPVYRLPDLTDFRYKELVGVKPVGCEVKYNQYCEFTESIRAPAGFQICRLSYSTVSERGDYAFKVTPVGWLPNEPGKTNRHTGLDLYFRATGHSNAGLNRLGARIEIENIRVGLLPSDADDSERRRRNCEIGQSPDAARPAPTAPRPTIVISRATVSGIRHPEGRTFTVRILNQTQNPTRTYYACWKFDRMFGREMIEYETTVSLQPGSSYSYDCHDWDAPNWRLQVNHLPAS